MEKHYRKILEDTRKRVERSLRTQIRDGEFKGGFRDDKGLVQAKYSIYRTTTATAAYLNQDSIYYHDERVGRMILEALDYIAAVQHSSGLFDLISCNFYSAPDTAFCIKRLLPCYSYLREHADGAIENEIYRRLDAIVRLGAQGLKTGGFHTPNHRWAIASNLLACWKLFGDDEMYACAQRYLREGIDCNEDGEYAEKSAGNYNRINNDAMITIGDVTGQEEFYGHAVRNLHMMMTYIEPDGSIFTANSTRQDRGKTIYPKDYYLEYLDMGLRRNIPEFLDMANYIFDIIEEKRLTAPDILIHLMNRPELRSIEHKSGSRREEFDKYYQDSGIVRVKEQEFSYTLMAGKSGFLNFSNGTMQMEMKIGGSFCEHRAFQAERIEKTEEGYCLSQVMRGWYYLPFEEQPPTADWWKMDHSKRERLLGPDLEIAVEVSRQKNGVDVHISAKGVTGAPFRVEMAVTGALVLGNETFAVPAEPGKTMLLKQGAAVFANEEDSLEIRGAFGNHMFTAGKFGSEEHSSCAFTLYFTDYTEFDHTIQIRTGKDII